MQSSHALEVVQVPRRFTRSDWGGTETTVLATSQQLMARGVQTEVCTSRALSTVDDERIDGVRVRRFGYFYPVLGLTQEQFGQLDRKGGNLFSFGLGWHLLRRPRLDLIHLHTGKRLGGIARTVARARGIPYVVSLHGGLLDVPASEAATLTAPLKGAFEWGRALGWCVGSRRVIEDAAAILCPGHAEAARVRERWPRQRVAVMPNGVDAHRFGAGDGDRFRARHGIPRDEKLVLCVARVDPQKNQAALVRILPHLRRRHGAVRLLLVGPVTTPAYREEVERIAAEAGVAQHVTLLPGIPPGERDLVDAYHAADVCVLPSLHEPFGIVILEAWAAGKPVVASRVGGIPGFVRDGVDALLTAPGDEAALAAQLDVVLGQPARAAELAGCGLARASREFDWARCTDRLEELYREVVEYAAVRRTWREAL